MSKEATRGYARLTFVAKGSKDKHLCQVAHCRKKHLPGRRVCNKHHVMSWRLNNPEKAAYAQLRESARRRSIPFEITLADFIDVVDGTGYLEYAGCSTDDLQIDRKDALLGYVRGNLRVITCGENAHKGACEDKQRKRAYVEAKIAAAQKLIRISQHALPSDNLEGEYSMAGYDPDHSPF